MEPLKQPPTLLRTTSSGSVSLNELETSIEDEEAEAIYLLRQIFPDSSASDLRKLHRKRVGDSRATPSSLNAESTTSKPAHDGLKSKLGQRLLSQRASDGPGSSPSWRNRVVLPHDFLRLTPDVAIRRLDPDTGQWHYQLISDLSARAIGQHRMLCSPVHDNALTEDSCYTKALFRDPSIGLGLTLAEQAGRVFVYSLTSRDGRVWVSIPETDTGALGPAILANACPGDVLIGVNGSSLLEGASAGETLLQHAVRSIRESDDPVVLHFIKKPSVGSADPAATLELLQLMADSSSRDESGSAGSPKPAEVVCHSTPMRHLSSETLVHPFVAALRKRNLLESFEAERANTVLLRRFLERANEWEDTSSLKAYSQDTKSYVPVPVASVRKALCVRILNAFLDGDEPAYTIWVFDVQTGSEWYAPVRYLRDFSDLRSALLGLHDSVSDYPFPKQSYSFFGSPSRKEAAATSETTCRQLEDFLRLLCSIIYREKIHPRIGEMAVYVQSFLGCEETVTGSHSRVDARFVADSLKRSIQQYTFRLFLLDALRNVVRAFIDMMRRRGPGLDDIEYLESQGRSVLKTKAMECLEETRAFLDQLQSMILEGCMDDFRSISARDEYALVQGKFAEDGGVVWEALIREAVREQIEIEVYVPLRGVISRWLVHGWKHEDMEIQFKVNELRKRPQDRFRISDALLSPSNWSTVCGILKGGVGQSTLPCVKLRAIVDAAREISLLVTSAHGGNKLNLIDGASDRPKILGADDFLPIFIYCVVKAEMDRPCALSVLLRTLCDPIHKIGEIGYYLACFESAIRHIRELDLSTDDHDAFSLLSIPLNDSY